MHRDLWVGMAVPAAIGLWWSCAPRSAIRFYGRLYARFGNRNFEWVSPGFVRVLGVITLIIAGVVVGAFIVQTARRPDFPSAYPPNRPSNTKRPTGSRPLGTSRARNASGRTPASVGRPIAIAASTWNSASGRPVAS